MEYFLCRIEDPVQLIIFSSKRTPPSDPICTADMFSTLHGAPSYYQKQTPPSAERFLTTKNLPYFLRTTSLPQYKAFSHRLRSSVFILKENTSADLDRAFNIPPTLLNISPLTCSYNIVYSLKPSTTLLGFTFSREH